MVSLLYFCSILFALQIYRYVKFEFFYRIMIKWIATTTNSTSGTTNLCQLVVWLLLGFTENDAECPCSLRNADSRSSGFIVLLWRMGATRFYLCGRLHEQECQYCKEGWFNCSPIKLSRFLLLVADEETFNNYCYHCYWGGGTYDGYCPSITRRLETRDLFEI